MTKTLDQWKEEWKALEPPSTTEPPKLTGVYYGHMHFLAVNFVFKFGLNMLWKGVEFPPDTTEAHTLVNILGSKEVGTTSISEASTHDGKPCLRVDFEDRFYEGRMLSDKEVLNIVTFKDKTRFVETGNISDVHILTAANK